MTLAEEKIYKKGFEAAFKLLTEYVDNGVDMDTARRNAHKIMNIKEQGGGKRFASTKRTKRKR